MANELRVSWRHSETDKRFLNLGDVDFYRSLPGMTENMKTTDGRLPGGSDTNQVIFWGGTAVLSSSVLAAAIKAYVTLKRRKVVITVGDKKLEYEGPDLEHDEKMIEAMIDKLS